MLYMFLINRTSIRIIDEWKWAFMKHNDVTFVE